MSGLSARRRPPPLWPRLQQTTQELSRHLERSPYFQELFFGAWGSSVYGQFARGCEYVRYLLELRSWYRALEAALRHCAGHPVVERLVSLEVWRSGAIESDLLRFAGPQALSDVAESHAVARYRERTVELAEEAPHLLAAHVYVQQQLEVVRAPLLRARVRSAFSLGEEGPGVSLYDVFPLSAERCFDTLPLRPSEAAETLVEARLVYRIRSLLLEELLRARWGLSDRSQPLSP
jgi:heme oxygenase (biliverdin-producing, ferredoxin)